MKVSVRSEKALVSLNFSMWDDIFTESVEGVNNIISVNAIEFNDSICFPTKNTDGSNAINEIVFCVLSEGSSVDIYELILHLDLEENLYDINNNLLNSEVFININSDIKVKFYYEIGNFLKKEKEKKKYSNLHSVY